MAIATLILALVSLGVGGYIAYAGGRVRHKEFGFEAPPEPNMTTPGRLDVARRLQDYNRAASEK